MGALFRNKAKAEGLLIYLSEHDEERGIFSETFKLWCVKLKDLTAENFQAGTIGMEQKAEAMYQAGEEMWPPSFAEFRALCFPKVDNDAQAHKILPSMFDPKNTHMLEDITSREKRYELGKQKSAELLAMFGSDPEPEQVLQPSQESLNRLEQAKHRLAKQGA